VWALTLVVTAARVERACDSGEVGRLLSSQHLHQRNRWMWSSTVVQQLVGQVSGSMVDAAMRGWRTRTERVVVSAALQATLAAAERAEADMALVALRCGRGKEVVRTRVGSSECLLPLRTHHLSTHHRTLGTRIQPLQVTAAKALCQFSVHAGTRRHAYQIARRHDGDNRL